jgi:isochorismate synthase
MNTTTSNTQTLLPGTLWPTTYNRQHLTQLFDQATTRAHDMQNATLLSASFSLEPYDPLALFAALPTSQQNRFFWSRPSEQRSLVGFDIATTITTDAASGIQSATAQWRALQQNALIYPDAQVSTDIPAHISGPVFFGGFAFDPSQPSTALWQDFPAGLLILPRLLFQRDGDDSTLTINVLISPTETYNPAAIAAAIEHIEKTLSTIHARLSSHLDGLDPSLEPAEFNEHDILPAAAWKDLVGSAVQTIRAQQLEKVVLARSAAISSDRPFDINATLRRLSDNYPGAYIFALQNGTHTFIGATPERLICGTDGQLQTMALAGSAPRGATPEEDVALGNDLLQNPKNRGEHRIVVNTIKAALSSLCSHVWAQETPRLRKLQNIQHLETPISGTLLPGRSILEAIEFLHPTPAVGGFPREAALTFIRDHEGLDRGWYAGPIGWVGTSGNGEFAVALRSALVEDNHATLFAGCGIVADSDPQSEYQESCLKLQPMRYGLTNHA